jgi:hypothetical protein
MRLPAITARLRAGDGRRAIVLRLEGSERMVMAPVTAAALLAGAILCAADAWPTLWGLSLVGYGLLAVALVLLARLVAAS